MTNNNNELDVLQSVRYTYYFRNYLSYILSLELSIYVQESIYANGA